MKLYGYWRSGTSHRVRLALGAKGLSATPVSIDLRVGEHKSEGYRALNPSSSVPLLELDDGTTLAQSGAIIEYLDERYPTPPLLPASAKGRARVRHLSQIIACDTHPLQNLRVQRYLKDELEQPDTEVQRWLAHFLGAGLTAFENALKSDTTRGDFCVGNQFSMAECHLIPQLYAARRFNIPIEQHIHILSVEMACNRLAFVEGAAPEAQPDAPRT